MFARFFSRGLRSAHGKEEPGPTTSDRDSHLSRRETGYASGDHGWDRESRRSSAVSSRKNSRTSHKKVGDEEEEDEFVFHMQMAMDMSRDQNTHDTSVRNRTSSRPQHDNFPGVERTPPHTESPGLNGDSQKHRAGQARPRGRDQAEGGDGFKTVNVKPSRGSRVGSNRHFDQASASRRASSVATSPSNANVYGTSPNNATFYASSPNSSTSATPQVLPPARNIRPWQGADGSVEMISSRLEGQALACRFWISMCLDYNDQPCNGFYDIWGDFPELEIHGGRLPSLSNLTAIRSRIAFEDQREVLLVDEASDACLRELKSVAVTTCQGLSPPERKIEALAELVAQRFGGVSVSGDAGLKLAFQREMSRLQRSCATYVVRIGDIVLGLTRHRALLFKVLAGAVGLRCRLVRGRFYCEGTDEAGVVLRRSDGSQCMVDLIRRPGRLVNPHEFSKDKSEGKEPGLSGSAPACEGVDPEFEAAVLALVVRHEVTVEDACDALVASAGDVEGAHKICQGADMFNCSIQDAALLLEAHGWNLSWAVDQVLGQDGRDVEKVLKDLRASSQARQSQTFSSTHSPFQQTSAPRDAKPSARTRSQQHTFTQGREGDGGGGPDTSTNNRDEEKRTDEGDRTSAGLTYRQKSRMERRNKRAGMNAEDRTNNNPQSASKSWNSPSQHTPPSCAASGSRTEQAASPSTPPNSSTSGDVLHPTPGDETRRVAREEMQQRQALLQRAERAAQAKAAKTQEDSNQRVQARGSARAAERIAEMREDEAEQAGLREKTEEEQKGFQEKYGKKIERLDLVGTLQLFGVKVVRESGNKRKEPSTADIRKAYREALLRFHPDRQQTQDTQTQVHAAEVFKVINKKMDEYSQ
eukprot:CAMPEP_0196589928 /NCGR_PEP_ID=MMETSP1081-20130531/65033_1 /TAXON_ID=36882 /ORGANISM="Pyramimonas amylifera, Strain CCMP720" /LENGTH=868 /DNA_ID=CAMNT_0041912871 /DNA_START=10 /DNA_END=2616 /DNA_ORIENTATION=+